VGLTTPTQLQPPKYSRLFISKMCKKACWILSNSVFSKTRRRNFSVAPVWWWIRQFLSHKRDLINQ
jgi:hypothetical protein